MATNTDPRPAMLSIRLDARALSALDSFALGRGGRSAILRQMIEQMLKDNSGRPLLERREGIAHNRISLRFTNAEIAVIENRASQRSTNRSGWIKALVRRHLALKSRVDDGDKKIENDLRRIADMRMEISEQIAAVGEAMHGDVSYWKVAD
jgi:metal-responsive CopG/Arc/MetJ family transcriptional regulator